MHSTPHHLADIVGSAPPADLRREPRFTANQPVTAQLLSGSRRRLSASIVNLSGRGLQIRVSEPLSPGELIEVRCENQMLLGEVRYCTPDAVGWLAGVEIEHALYELKSLRRYCRG